MAETAKRRTYVTARFNDGTVEKSGKNYKRVMNLFYQGGKDKAGNPVLSNAEEKVLALVDKKNGVLSLFRTDDKGAQISDGDKPAKAFLTIGLDRFTDLTTNPRTLEVGQGAVTGPASAELVDAFKAVLGAKAEKKAKPSQPGM